MASLDWLRQGAAAARAGARDSPRREDFAIKVGLGFQSRAGAASGKNVCCLASLRRHGTSTSTSGVGLGLATSSRQVRLARLTAKFRFDDSGNGGKRNGGGGTNVGGMVLNAAITGALAYLTVTGKLGWIFDAVISLWLFFILAPLVALVAYFWFVEREIITVPFPRSVPTVATSSKSLNSQSRTSSSSAHTAHNHSKSTTKFSSETGRVFITQASETRRGLHTLVKMIQVVR
ncbi:uncharacterized protein LOC9660865 isoform X2 [Selaginella moellendorffii]|uniref:uncharacterized protein LOC9660865 isoform X2 n=1 Tax=Selaginella moellendorffii TaxID=88036 RepID=UPI000D1CA94C|nr:uncharacterized protein LOC9660865 isoform X2 [Selaginella moellendorffii]|eukprot:XP_024543146.1 uncharacterized protein LOC9660865 isoform X2 [Selaginella moellendorffii]